MRLVLALPGRWFRMPLGDPAAGERIRELATELVGGRDDRAGTRIALRRRLEAALERAGAGGAEQLHLGLALEPDVPMPAVASVYPGLPVPAESADADVVLAALVPLVLRAAHEPAGGTATPGDDDRVFAAGRSRILRRPAVRDVQADASTGNAPASGTAPAAGTVSAANTVPSLTIDYWLTVPGERRAALLHLDLPLLAPAALLLALGDAIALAARFEPTGGLAEELRADA
ncbi:hypothetical protein [Agrococcus citreus]|uniref:Uncharacterized protein n=1 Tax=Agrococcus citreus TaxID=84643 RepID=A0ABN1YT14_9MICO